ncbi:MAG: hypothetical protein RIC35_20765 [Marinoscillum sp.]
MKSKQEIVETNNADGYQLTYEPEGSVFSSFKLVFISTYPNFEPSKEDQKLAIEFVASELENYIIQSTETEHPTFEDSGEGFESVRCNNCGQLMEIAEWHEHLDEAYKTEFEELDVIPNCCKKRTSLNDLIYNMDSGFSKYSLAVNGFSPYDDEQLTEQLTEHLERIFDTDLRTLFVKF